MIFIRVDLPAPFSPTRAWISPFAIATETLRNALTPPNRLLMCSTRIISGFPVVADDIWPIAICLALSLPAREGESRSWLYLLGRLLQIVIRTRAFGQIGKVLGHVLCVECLLDGGISLPRLEFFDVGGGHDISRDLQPAR